MTNFQFKLALQSELNSACKSFRNPLKSVTETDTNTFLNFSYHVDDDTKEWLNTRFKHGVKVCGNIAIINNPNG